MIFLNLITNSDLIGRLAEVRIQNAENKRQIGLHHHEFYEIEFLTKGSGVCTVDGVKYTATPGDLFLLKLSSFHETCFFEGSEYITIMFPLTTGILGFLSALPVEKAYISLHLSEVDIALMRSLAIELKQCLEEDSSPENPYAASVLNCILGKICSQIHRAAPKNTSAMSRAILYLQNHFTEDISLGQVAAIANYSSNYFSTQFKQLTGMSFKLYLTNLRYSYARKLLKTTDLSINDICLQSGFNDYSHFMTTFKDRYGMSPKRFRNDKDTPFY